MGYEAILFDMDGVIIDTRQAVTAFWEKYARRQQVQLTPGDWEQHIYGCPANHTLDRLFPRLKPEERRVIIDDLAAYEANLSYSPMGGVIFFLRSLHQEHIPTALVTSGDRHKVKEVTGQLGLSATFSATITVEDIRRGKPDPECYLLAARALQKSPERCLVFEDSISGVKAATSAGALCIGIQSPPKTAALIEAGARYVIADFSETRLAGTDGNSPEPIQLQIEPGRRLSLLVSDGHYG